MIPRGCILSVIDNSGARLAQVIGFYGQQGQYGYVGDVVKVAIKDAKGEKIQAGATKKAVITGDRPQLLTDIVAHFFACIGLS